MNASNHKTSQITALVAGMAALIGGNSAHADLTDGLTLTIGAGSEFTMEVSPGFHLPTAITGFDGLVLGTAQAASGSHSGAPNGSESPGIDTPWSFFGNTGMHYTASDATVLSASGDTATVDLSGWGVTWNGIAAIPMGSGAWGTNPEGVAEITCDATCAPGESYSLYYTARVPMGDPSGFGNVAYGLTLEGTITTTLPSIDAEGSDGGGAIDPGVSGPVSRTSLIKDDLLDNDYVPIGPLFEFTVAGVGLGGKAVVTLHLGNATIQPGAVYRKYRAGTGWYDFDTSGLDTIESGKSADHGADSPCLASDGSGTVVYSPGLSVGHNCVRLTIHDNGENDADGVEDGNVVDPGGVIAPGPDFTDTRTSGSSGCTIATRPGTGIPGDWLLIGGLLAGLGMYRRRLMP